MDTSAVMTQPLAVAMHAARAAGRAGRSCAVIGPAASALFIVAAAPRSAPPTHRVDVADDRLATAAGPGATDRERGRAMPSAGPAATGSGRTCW
jgi:threonine dehydrogenase-like Zn-dependent dehydrogenase